MSEAGPTEDLADLYDNAPCGYLSLSPDRQIVKINRTLRDWLGRPEHELLGHSILELLNFGGRIAFETHLAPLLRLQGYVYEIALELLDARGERIPVIANATEKRSPAGEHLFTRLTIFRAVDRRTFERSLIEGRIRAEADAKAKDELLELHEQFIAVLGHDLRNPLAAIRAGIRLLRGSDALGARETMIAGQMEASIDRANALIADVLDFARGKLGEGLTIDCHAGRPLVPVLEQVAAEMRAIHPRRDLRERYALDAPVSCDAERIGQLASNLLANAISHGDPDRSILLEARSSTRDFSLSVANYGEAIPDAVRQKLFQPFFRGSGKGNRKGLGLGLFIVNEIAKAHGGTMECASTAEETRFTLTIPQDSAMPDGAG